MSQSGLMRVGWTAVGCLILASCGGSSGGSTGAEPSDIAESVVEDSASPETPSTAEPAEPAEPAQDVAADTAAAEAALLTLSDFPAGWSEVPDQDDEDDSSEEMRERAQECLGSDTIDILNNETEAKTGEFTDPADDSTVSQAVSLAPTVELAEAYMAGGSADGAAACLTTVYREGFAEAAEDAEEMQDAELGEITIGALNVGEIGEESFAYRITIPITIQGFTVDIVADLVAVRVGRSVSGLSFGSTFNSTPIERITEYATLAASRLPG